MNENMISTVGFYANINVSSINCKIISSYFSTLNNFFSSLILFLQLSQEYILMWQKTIYFVRPNETRKRINRLICFGYSVQYKLERGALKGHVYMCCATLKVKLFWLHFLQNFIVLVLKICFQSLPKVQIKHLFEHVQFEFQKTIMHVMLFAVCLVLTIWLLKPTSIGKTLNFLCY